MKKIIISSIVLILLFAGAYYVVSNKDFSLVSDKSSTNNNSSNKESSKSDTSKNSKNSGNSSKNNANKVLAPDFTLSDLEGNTVTLSELRGKKVFLNFWASWCGPCKAEMPDIEKLYQETKDSDLVILAVNVSENKSTAESYLKNNNLNFTVLMDTKDEASNTYVIRSIPSSFFIDKEGYIVSREVGTLTYAEMKDFIKALD